MTKLPNEFSDPEKSYRRGYQHGAWDVLNAVKEKLSEHDAALLELWFSEEVCEWRRVGMRGESVRASGMDPFPAGVSPPRETLRELGQD